MTHRTLDYSYILATVCFTVYGQLIIKWRITSFPALPLDFFEKIRFLISIIFDPIIFLVFSRHLSLL